MRTIPRELLREDIGWLAGIVDGESSIHCKYQEEKRPFFSYNFTIVNTNKELLEKCSHIVFSLCKDLPESSIRVYPKIYKNSITAKNAGINSKKPFGVHRIAWLQRIFTILLPHVTEKRDVMKKFLSITNLHKLHQRYKIEKARLNGLVETKRKAPQGDEAIVRTSK